VSTNIGKHFLRLLDSEFPHGHRLNKLFNRNNTKLSYSCCPNIKTIIDKHNKSVLDKPIIDKDKTCNCRVPEQCPVNGKCMTEQLIYQAAVTTESNNSPPQTYIGLTETSFKTRYNNHTSSFRHSNKRNSTELSKYIWHLKDQDIDFSINWRIMSTAKSFNTNTKRCNLCLLEKFYIVYKPNSATLNNRNELVTMCRHARKHLLGHIT